MRRTGILGFRTWVRCQLIDCPRGQGRCQQQLRGLLDGCLQMRDLFPLVRGDDVIGCEVLIDVHAHAAPVFVLDLLRHLGSRLRKIANVPIARLDSILVAEEAAKNLRLGGRFDDDQGFSSQPLPFVLHVLPGPSDRCPRMAQTVTLARSSRADETATTLPADQTCQFELDQPGQQSARLKP